MKHPPLLVRGPDGEPYRLDRGPFTDRAGWLLLTAVPDVVYRPGTCGFYSVSLGDDGLEATPLEPDEVTAELLLDFLAYGPGPGSEQEARDAIDVLCPAVPEITKRIAAHRYASAHGFRDNSSEPTIPASLRDAQPSDDRSTRNVEGT